MSPRRENLLMNPAEELEERLQFETLLADMAARFVNLPAERVDWAIGDSRRRLCETLGLDRSELYLGTDANALLPWAYDRVRRGEAVGIPDVDGLPDTAAADKVALRRSGTRSVVIVPLCAEGSWLGCLSFASSCQTRNWPESLVKRLEVVGGLFASALDRKRLEQALRESEARLGAILATAVEGIITINEGGQIETVNPAAEQMFGYRADELIGRNVDLLMPSPFHDEPDRYVNNYLQSGRAKIIGIGREVSGRRKDRSVFPVDLAVSETRLPDRRIFTGFVRDITARKKAEEALRESEARFRMVADSAPVMIWMAGPDKLCNFFNKPWLDFTGRTMEQESGNGWAEGVHPDDLRRCLKSYLESFDARQAFVLQYRLRRHDGEYRWILDNGVPRYDAQRVFSGYIGSCVDITARKQAEEAGRDLSGRLINAQEEERTRLARELQDDVTQRLARLAIDIGRIERGCDASSGWGELLRGVREGLACLSEDVHALAYRLHSAVLEDLGLVDALKAECEKFSRRESIPAELTLRELPVALPRDVSICIFRIAQEALRNVARHAKAGAVTVSLRSLEGGLQLAVRDDGIGLDPALHCGPASLGHASMRERTRMLGGELNIESSPGRGTTVLAWVPLREAKS